MSGNWEMTCPFCGKMVRYWPNCSPKTAADYNNYGWVMHGNTKQFLHLDCLRKASGKKNK